MTKEITMNTKTRRIAINVGAGFIPGMNAVVAGAALAAGELGWELVGIRNGFDGLLHTDQHPDGGLVVLDRQRIENLDPAGGGVLGQAPRVDPFHVRQVNDGMVEEVDLSDHLLERLKEEQIDALISVVGGRGLSVLYKLHRKGLNTVCIPRSIENDIAATMVSFGFNSALSFTIEMLDRILPGGQICPPDRRGGGPGRVQRLAGAAGGYRGCRRCHPDSRDPLRSSRSGSETDENDVRRQALRAGSGGGRSATGR